MRFTKYLFLVVMGFIQFSLQESQTNMSKCQICKSLTQAFNSQLTQAKYVSALSLLTGGDQKSSLYILQSFQDLIFTPNYMCNKVLTYCSNTIYQEVDEEMDVEKILAGKPSKILDNNYIDSLYFDMRTHEKERKTLKFLHIADIHLDLWYQEGAIADCQQGYCCRNDTYKGRGSIPAGKFGSLDGSCDIPQITLENALNFMKEKINPDYVFWTGDNSAHDNYRKDQWPQQVPQATNVSAKLIQETFADKKNSTFAVFGNHDIYPHWDFTKGTNPAAFSSMPFWKEWLDNDVYENFTKTGYYSQTMKTIKNKTVKVIGINTESCDQENPFIYAELKDPNHQIEFLINELNQIEQQNGLAIIVGHITPDDGCSHQFALRLRAIMERYQHIIRLNLFAHTHSDIFKLAMSFDEDPEPVGYLSVCSSLTTWGGNPTFCVLEVDEETLLPVQKYVYYFDMRKANSDGFITWDLFTNWTSLYQLDDMSPNSLLKLTNKFLTDADLATYYNSHKNRNTNAQCRDQGCMKNTYCDAITFDYYERANCRNESINNFKSNPVGSLFNIIQETWVEQIPSAEAVYILRNIIQRLQRKNEP